MSFLLDSNLFTNKENILERLKGTQTETRQLVDADSDSDEFTMFGEKFVIHKEENHSIANTNHPMVEGYQNFNWWINDSWVKIGFGEIIDAFVWTGITQSYEDNY